MADRGHPGLVRPATVICVLDMARVRGRRWQGARPGSASIMDHDVTGEATTLFSQAEELHEAETEAVPCSICQMLLNGVQGYMAHLKSKRHRANKKCAPQALKA